MMNKKIDYLMEKDTRLVVNNLTKVIIDKDVVDIKYTVFTLENHITYQKEVPKNETLNVSVQLIDFDQKRCHVFMNMFNGSNELCSTYEVMLMGIDVESGRPSAFPDNIMEQIKNESVKKQDDSLPRELGRQIGIKRK